jgi:undecaprenyl-diphosphatase
MKLRRVLAVGVVAAILVACAISASADIVAVDRKSDQLPAPAPEPEKQLSTLDAAILGVIQGLTEYLPVSSTGHLILANHAMGYSPSVDPAHPLTSGFREAHAIHAFDVILHAGTFLAVLGLYRRRVGQMARGLVGKDAAGLRLLVLLSIAFVPAAIVGKLYKDKIEELLYNPVAVAAALAVGGVLMIVIEHFFWRRRREAKRITDVCQVPLMAALVIGLAQCVAMWPGTSRSMITILAGLVLGLDMLASAEFSFLLALPTLGAATLYTGYKSWSELTSHVGPVAMIVGLVVTTLVATVAVRGFIKWLGGHGLMPFGVYRLVLAAAVFGYFLL